MPVRIMLTSDAIGGVWSYTLSLAAGLVSIGCACTIVLLGPAPTRLQQQDAERSGVALMDSELELDWVSRSPTDVVTTSLRLAEIAKLLNVELVHVHTPVFSAVAWAMPVVATAHSCLATWWKAVQCREVPASLLWQKELMSKGLSAANAIIAPSHSFAAALRDVYGEIEGLSVVLNGSPDLALMPTGPEMPTYVISSGRLWDEGKNMRTLDAAAGLQTCPVVLAGSVSGPDGSQFAAKNSSTLGVLPHQAVLDAYRHASVFAAPSLYEPFGLAVLEAASLAVPLLLADIPTFRELWHDAAMFVPPRDSTAWADAISWLMANDAERARLGFAARQRSVQYAQTTMVNQTHLLHVSVLEKSRSQGAS